MSKEDKNFMFQNIRECGGSGEGGRIYLATTMSTGESEIVIEHTITERYPTKDYDKVIDLYERLHCGGGRKMFKLEELSHPHNPK